MNDESKHDARAYRSELRADQARATRTRILEAVMGLIAAGNRELAYTAIARAARVSVPTVYRHFPERQALFEGIFAMTESAAPAAEGAYTPALMQGALREFFSRFDDPEGIHAKAVRLNVIWEFSRATTVPRRRAWFEAEVSRRLPHVQEPHRTWIVDLCVVLVSSAIAEAMRGYLDRSGSETADRVLFAIEAIFVHAATLFPPEAP